MQELDINQNRDQATGDFIKYLKQNEQLTCELTVPCELAYLKQLKYKSLKMQICLLK